MRVLPIAITAVLASVVPLAAMAQQGTATQAATEKIVDAQDQADVRALMAELETLKGSYAQEVRRLRELDMRVQALQSRVDGKIPPARAPLSTAPQSTAGAPAARPPSPGDTATPAAASSEGYASTAAEAAEAREASKRSVDDVKQQVAAVFDRRLTIENSLSYNRYDRKQLTLTGFLALDAIFLGNIAIENVESDTLVYNVAARYGVLPNMTVNVDIPFVARKTVYQKGGAGGSAGAVAQEDTNGYGIGDLTVSGNYRAFAESARWPETVFTAGVTVPTGREPYGISWNVLERDDDGFIRFAVPEKEPTGNGVWQTNLGVSVVKTADPAILFGNFGYIHSFRNSFDDLDNNPETVNPGDVQLGRSFYFGAGVAFAFNERTSLSISYSDKLSARARTRYDGEEWNKIIGSDANAAMFNLGVTYALSPHTTLVSSLGIGLTPDAPDFSLVFKVPYMF